jgi:hypothetical protein
MKRFWPCLLAVVVLASCTEVEDFGAYWAKGFIDPALEGSWKKQGLPGQDPHDIPGPDLWRFTRDGSVYSVNAINPIDPTAEPGVLAQQKADNEGALNARTLRIGKHMFLMQLHPVERKGLIERYEVRRGTLQEYYMDNGAVLEFLKAKHPTARNIKRNVGEGEYVVIDTFDDEVFQVLSEIADNPAYWILTCRYQKVS